MRLKKIEIKNYRSLKDITIEFGDLTVLIGKNDTGKSNILKALNLFLDLNNLNRYEEIGAVSSVDSKNIFDQERGIPDYRIFYDQKPCTITMVGDFELNNDEIRKIFVDPEIEIKRDGEIYKVKDLGSTFAIGMEIVGLPNKKLKSYINSIKFGEVVLLMRQGTQEQKRIGDWYLKEILKKLCEANFYLVPAVRALKKESRDAQQLSLEGSGVPSHYLRLEKDVSIEGGEDTFSTIGQEMAGLCPEYRPITSKEDGQHNVEIYFEKFSSASVGDGIKQAFLNVFNLLRFKNKIVGIEEPEIHFHPEMQRRIFNVLREKSKERQIVITTHSPIFVNSSKSCKTYLVIKDRAANATKVRSIAGRHDFKAIKLELGARNTDLFFYDCAVLIEGDTEERALPIIADSMGYDLGARGIKLINIGGSGKYTKMAEFLKYLKDSGVAIYVIVDGHKDASTKIRDWEREGLLGKENCTIWERDFEDVLGVERVVDAMKEIAKEGKFKFSLTSKDLRRKKESGKSIAEILQQWLYEEKLPPLNKPALGEKLGLLVANEIDKGCEREETKVEQAIRKIIKLVEQNSAPLASSE